MLEVDPRWPRRVFNTTCLIGPEGILYKYRKVNPWIPYEVHASPHDLDGYDEPLFPVADTPIGRHRLRDLLRLAVPRGDPPARGQRRRGAGPRVRLHGPVGRDRADELVDDRQPLPRAREHRLRRRRQSGREPAALSAVLVARRQPGRGLRRPAARRGLARARRADRRRADRHQRAASRAREPRRGHHMLAHLRTEAYPVYRRHIYPAAHETGADITYESNLERIEVGAPHRRDQHQRRASIRRPPPHVVPDSCRTPTVITAGCDIRPAEYMTSVFQRLPQQRVAGVWNRWAAGRRPSEGRRFQGESTMKRHMWAAMAIVALSAMPAVAQERAALADRQVQELSSVSHETWSNPGATTRRSRTGLRNRIRRYVNYYDLRRRQHQRRSRRGDAVRTRHRGVQGQGLGRVGVRVKGVLEVNNELERAAGVDPRRSAAAFDRAADLSATRCSRATRFTSTRRFTSSWSAGR